MNLLRMALVVILGALSSGCYHYRVLNENASPTFSTEYKKGTSHALFWGLVQEDIRAYECEEDGKSSGLEEVHMSTNLGFTLITIGTLGIWSPMHVEYRCRPMLPEEGRI